MTSLQSPHPQAVDASHESTDSSGSSPSWKIKLLYDGKCPLCLREVNFLRRKDAGRGLVAFTDVADPEYCPEDNGGVSFEAAMGRIHAVLPDNTAIKNVEVFRQVYTVLGIGWLYAPTKWPVIGWLVDKAYDFWADRRLAWTGRPPLEELVAQHYDRSPNDLSSGCIPDSDGSSRCRVD
ncbi:MAG: thiol-disulfide oxidoreductase DCC family protein [Leptolyngbyaceae cyanobacterium]